jgi:hypothetical protein
MADVAVAGPVDDGRASYQVELTVCDECARASQRANGEQLEVSPQVAAMASCDSQQLPSAHVGNKASGKLHRATQDVPPAVRRAVLRRDRHRCQAPGCRHADFLDVHHIQPREEGGQHELENLLTLCGAHRACHGGALRVTGSLAAGLTFHHADGTPRFDTFRARFLPETEQVMDEEASDLQLLSQKPSCRHWAESGGARFAGEATTSEPSCAEEDRSRRPRPGGFRQELESVAQDELQLGIVAKLSGNMQERFASCFFLETEAAKSLKCPRLQRGPGRRDRFTVARAVCMTESEPGRRAARHAQPTVVARSVMSATQRDQILGVMRPAFFAQLDVVQIHEIGVATARYSAAM